MHWLDIFYLTLVITAFTGFALTLAYFFHWAGPAQSGSAQVDSPAKPASARAKPKADCRGFLSTPKLATAGHGNCFSPNPRHGD